MSLGPDARALIQAAAHGDDPSADDERRIRNKLATRIVVAGAAGAAGVAATKVSSAAGAGGASMTPAAIATMSLTTKIGVAVALVTATSVGAMALHGDSKIAGNAGTYDAPPAVIAPSRAPILAPQPSLQTLVDAVETPPAPPSSSSPASPTRAVPNSQPKTAVKDTILEEAKLLRQARAALDGNDGRAALRALDEHATRFPNGALSEERSAVRVLALCAAGRLEEARSQARAFLSARPQSPMAEQLRRSCAVESSFRDGNPPGRPPTDDPTAR